ncbi:MAG: putative 2OG-Fe(II) oxygenase [Gammaproteobacteria bacterium]|jgi:hypothetical protein
MTDESQLPGLSKHFDHGAHDFTMVKPFGPNILETRIPSDILSQLISMADALMENHNRQSYGEYLVGQIHEEPEIPLALLREYGVFDYLHSMFAEYVLASTYCDGHNEYKRSVAQFQQGPEYHNPVYVQLEAAWLVNQMAHEYNPVHNHSQSTLSSVLYLEVPKNMQEREIPGKARIDGAIEWVYQSVGQDQNATIRTVPKVGMFYIFPATLLHLVYPFRGPEVRRSISINATHRL